MREEPKYNQLKAAALAGECLKAFVVAVFCISHGQTRCGCHHFPVPRINPVGLDSTLRWVALIEALASRNEDDLRAVLRGYAEHRDRRSDVFVTDNMEAMARYLPPASWSRRVLAMWDETAATKTGYFVIVWGCAIPALRNAAHRKNDIKGIFMPLLNHRAADRRHGVDIRSRPIPTASFF